MKLESTLTGVAGEYFVAAELTLREYLAAITLRNSRGTDIIATTSNATRSFSIQVKTNSNGKPSWLVGAKSEKIESNTHFYVFVALKEIGVRPDYYIVPSAVVAKTIRESHQAWLSEPKKNGDARKDSSMRKFLDEEKVYLEKWDILPTESQIE